MEILNNLRKLSSKIEELKSQITTEEATKTAFVMPFIQLLGYDIFNPTEVVPEFTADLGIKKGEKVDFAVFENGFPILIIECKKWMEDLNVHNSQLHRYFHVTKTRFALLTNGIEYRFYADLEKNNIMDDKPFLEFTINNLKESTANEVAKFHKSNFDVNKILSNASALKYTKELKKLIYNELSNPTVEFVKLFANRVYKGRLTEKVVEQFTDMVTKAANQMISDKVSDRLTSALSKETEQQLSEDELNNEEPSKIITTEEEMEAYRIVKAILRRKVSISRIHHRDTQSYFGILLDDNNRKPICRLHLDGSKKQISLFDRDKIAVKKEIESLDDIYSFENELLATIELYHD
ncbi:type I restriction endonuclease [Robertkochia solimangrovi]|uniref:type I restriction endonuclease n=1 Tax=Robertkochia solimangrovi TaxID=2213046 RepID=UPI00117FC341|nr:type I restriction endonuclease [Robertkochia solimangrovi]TRZ44453.1 restriction endonuclease [Robertkochia solimangrovi]